MGYLPHFWYSYWNLCTCPLYGTVVAGFYPQNPKTAAIPAPASHPPLFRATTAFPEHRQSFAKPQSLPKHLIQPMFRPSQIPAKKLPTQKADPARINNQTCQNCGILYATPPPFSDSSHTASLSYILIPGRFYPANAHTKSPAKPPQKALFRSKHGLARLLYR